MAEGYYDPRVHETDGDISDTESLHDVPIQPPVEAELYTELATRIKDNRKKATSQKTRRKYDVNDEVRALRTSHDRYRGPLWLPVVRCCASLKACEPFCCCWLCAALVVGRQAHSGGCGTWRRCQRTTSAGRGLCTQLATC